ncbi:hypothetical protein OG285_35555 [Streptomyces sp. NBC_01471]|uniref:hypothetical protein n=1 Tax=Streptomyces sp. NBC_01471 TaxID=2903879 RepID=UPI00324A8F12
MRVSLFLLGLASWVLFAASTAVLGADAAGRAAPAALLGSVLLVLSRVSTAGPKTAGAAAAVSSGGTEDSAVIDSRAGLARRTGVRA